MDTFLRACVVLSAISFSVATPCRAQCHQWDERFAQPGGTDDTVYASVVHDDGSGPALYVGGSFLTAGSVISDSVARWNGTEWSAVGTGINGHVRALAVYDAGSGPELYAGGFFQSVGGVSGNRVAKWNGTSWSSASPTILFSPILSFAVFDDGSGSQLYMGGAFASIGSLTVNNIARWNGTSWTPVGGGTNNSVRALTVFDNGSGAKLFAGGHFTTAGGVSTQYIARWNGTNWSAVGAGTFDDDVVAMAVFDDGSGPDLYAGGEFSTAPGAPASRIAKWNGNSWSALGSGLNGDAYSVASIDLGGGPVLCAGGAFSVAGGTGATGIASWNGSTWSSLGSGMTLYPPQFPAPGVNALTTFDDGAGPRLYAGGSFSAAGGEGAINIAEWDGGAWASLGGGLGLSETGGGASAFAVYDDGSGPALYWGGEARRAGNVLVYSAAKWNGSGWSALGSGLASGPLQGRVRSMLAFDDGGGNALFAAGNFITADGMTVNNIAKWNGTSWAELNGGSGAGTNGEIMSLALFDDGSGPALYAGGLFNSAGGVACESVAKWDGLTWQTVGTGINENITAVEVFDDGSGPALYAAGGIAAGSSQMNIVKWNGSIWSVVAAVDDGPEDMSFINALKAFDDGGGPALFVGGSFHSANGTTAHYVAKWNGSSWSALGSGMSGFSTLTTNVASFGVFDDGSGPALYAGGMFHTAGGVSCSDVARWNGTGWSALGTGVNGIVTGFGVFDDGLDGAPDLYISGGMSIAGSTGSSGIAEWHGCEPGVSYCFGDGIDPVVTAQCPCSNFGDPGHGCANSNPALGGARLWATGTTSPNTLLFTCEGIPNNALATFWRGTTNTAAGGVVHDGIQCLGGTTIRFGTQNAGQLGNPPFTVSSGAIGLAPGATRYYQVLYRNPAPAFCPPGTYNFSNGYIVTW